MLLTILGILTAVGNLSGIGRVSFAKDRFDCAVEEYKRLIEKSESLRSAVSDRLFWVGKEMEAAVKTLKTANRILSPLEKNRQIAEQPEITNTAGAAVVALDHSSLLVSEYSKEAAACVGFGMGSAIAVGSWTAVSMFGTASTGAAIASLHGAAATSATLASFGHGAVAAGGAGVLGGKLALGGIVLLPVAAVLGIAAHAKAFSFD